MLQAPESCLKYATNKVGNLDIKTRWTTKNPNNDTWLLKGELKGKEENNAKEKATSKKAIKVKSELGTSVTFISVTRLRH